MPLSLLSLWVWTCPAHIFLLWYGYLYSVTTSEELLKRIQPWNLTRTSVWFEVIQLSDWEENLAMEKNSLDLVELDQSYWLWVLEFIVWNWIWYMIFRTKSRCSNNRAKQVECVQKSPHYAPNLSVKTNSIKKALSHWYISSHLNKKKLCEHLQNYSVESTAIQTLHVWHRNVLNASTCRKRSAR